jgi:signal transduction histidine kinase
MPVIVGIAPERGSDGHVASMFGVAYSRSEALRTHARHVFHGVSLLPPTLREPGDDSSAHGARVDNASLAVRLRYATGLRDEVSTAATDHGVWNSVFVATRAIDDPGGAFTVEVAVPERVGERFVSTAMPTRSEQLMLVGVLLLGLGFAIAAAFGLLRQYKLAEARRTFVAAVSHELRTPLAHVNALSETLLLGRAESPEQEQRWLRAIHREGRRLSVLTENVLLHARGERRGIRTAPQFTDVVALVRDAVSLVEAQAQAHSARIVVVGSAVSGMAGGESVWIDANAVRLIVINLIEIALKFGPHGQTVTVTVDLERATSNSDSAGLLRLSVDDEGPGVPEADRERIWRPFVRLAEGGTAPAGTGLGLSVVRQLVDELGGRFMVSNVPGCGARFSVDIPLASPPPRAENRAVQSATTLPAHR